jgi:hypothetical protein
VKKPHAAPVAAPEAPSGFAANLYKRGNDTSLGRANGAPATSSGTPAPTVARPASRDAESAPAQRIAREQVRLAIEKHRAELLAVPGVLGVRAGYKVSAGWVSTTPAIVVTVRQKVAMPKLSLPDSLDGVLVDVEPATPRQQLLGLSPEAQRGVDMRYAADLDELIRTSRYVPPPDLALDEVTAPMKILCHTSPDAGWPTLKGFLGDTTQRLTVAMYDFTAPHIRDQLKTAMERVSGNLRLVLDPNESLTAPGDGENPKANDVDEETVREALQKALGNRFEFVWAAVKISGKTTGGIFGSAYHIKVAVRDGRSFWLSSGNWQSSNQPDLDPLANGADNTGVLDTYNREWHVIVDHPAIAQTFEQFIEWDYSHAEPLQAGPEAARLPTLLMPPADELAGEEVAPQWFAPQQFEFTDGNPVRVQPLLSPDNYAAKTLELIQSARRTLYIQNQYIKLSKQAKDDTPEFAAILNAVKKCIQDGVEVRIIVRDLPDVRQQLEALQQFGIPLDHVKVLKGTHTKGIVVDSSVVSIGSHNWSNDGVVYNRDASLIVYDEKIAKFFEQVFLFDWSRARQQLGFESAMPLVSTGAESAPAGYRETAWSEVYDGWH